MEGYVFLANSTKPTEDKYNSREDVHPSNVSRPCLKKALEMGYKVYLGINRKNPGELRCDLPVEMYDEHTYRSLFAIKDNFIAYKNLSHVMTHGNIAVIHCNTPIGGLIGRICGKRHGVKRIIYTAHGFHFYEGAPLLNQTLFKWAEQIMAHWTDAIITMNSEDFYAAKRFRLRNGGKVYLVHGVGITLSDFDGLQDLRPQKRQSLGLSGTDIALISAGDLVARKNYETAIRAIAGCSDGRVHYYICGKGEEEQRLKRLSKELGVENQVHFLGFRTDVTELMTAADVFLFTTRQEGMPRSMMEAMASGLPCLASRIRGNTDLIEDGVNGFLFEPDDVQSFTAGIRLLIDNAEMRRRMSENNLKKIRDYDISVVETEISQIYDEVLENSQKD